jgi:hypothetical protein
LRVLLDRGSFLEEVRSGRELAQKSVALLGSSTAMFAIYGALMGAYYGPWQALSSAIKLPLLFLVTAAICFPTLYILSAFFGAKTSVGQYVAIVLAALAVSGMVLIAFAPITAFFLMTSADYPFFKLINVAVLGLSSFLGVKSLYRQVLDLSPADDPTAKPRRRLLTFWVVLFAFVGSQLGWTLRPFFGAPGMRFEIVRELGGNFYLDIMRSLREMVTFPDESPSQS